MPAGPALVSGNSVILKAAEDTPATAVRFMEIMKEAGIPDGVINLIHGYGPEAGAPLVEADDVDLISFTGSSETGQMFSQNC